MRPGRTVKREASMTSWSAGGPALAPAVVTVSIRPLWITTAASRTGGAPVPSMSVPARRIFMAALPGWCQPATGRRQRLKLYRESLPLDTAAVRPRLLGRRQMSGHAGRSEGGRRCPTISATRSSSERRPRRWRHSGPRSPPRSSRTRSEEHTSELQSRLHLVCRLLLEKKKKKKTAYITNTQRQENSRSQAHQRRDSHTAT